ncbi:hypothetical protein N7460_000279 [Penicillium canescens]|uniref:Uncharacterized protein n=1 Tax=Penicillium canescens TaxID=5083 RepID=A0AAD6IMB5_PENCN|nr:hypothetical protein N7460_000279 [Penicillium canescens]
MANDNCHLGEIIPPWGSLPIEQYLIRNWNHSATDAASQQRQRLIHLFLELDEIPEEYVCLDEFPPRMPTPVEINTILQPWRPDNDLRRKAYYMSKDDVLVFLRTHYDPNDDDKMNEWIHETDLFEDNAWWACLNNPYLFNFGPDWQQVYEIMPEVAGPVDHRRRSDGSGKPQSFRASPEKNREGLHERRCDRSKTTVDLANHLQNVSIMVYIVIADQEAFQTGRLRLLCLDAKRNIVREVRVDWKPAGIMQLIRHSDPIFRP